MAKTAFIYETLNDVKKMAVKKTDEGLMTLSGTFGVCGVRNNNNRVYETSNYAKMVDEMKERIKNEGGIPGELEHPQFMNITLENISHKITDINIDENGVVTGTIVLLNTPKGQIAQAIVEGGLPLFISSRATGAVNQKTGAVTLEKISTYDLVGSPGFSQAKLHLNENQVAESINESQVYYITEKEQENNTDNMETIEQIQERLHELENKVTLLEQENKQLKESAPDMKGISEAIQKWIVEEYSPRVEQWVVEEYTEDIKQNIISEAVEAAKSNFINEMAPRVQNWIVNDFSPMIQQWVVEHYTPEIHNWCVEEFAQSLQNWITEEFTPELDKWAKNDLAESIKSSMESKINEAIDNSKKNSLDAIANTVTLLESLEAQGSQKPTYTRKVNEGAQEPKFIAEMPEASRVKWNMSTPEIKESVMRRARLYNFNQEGAVQKFWESIDLDSIQPARSIYEGLENITDERERSIRAAFRAHRKF